MKSTAYKSIPLALLACLAHQTYAAAPPGIGEAIQQVRPAAPLPDKAPPPDIDSLSPAEPPLSALPGSLTTVEVKGFRFTGNVIYSTDRLQTIMSSAVGSQVSLADLHTLATRITRLYRDSGYFVARAYVPAQELVDGVVTVRIIEGHYGDFLLDHHGRLKLTKAQAILDAVKDNDIVSVDTLERVMLVLNDTPGVHVTQVSVSPGQKLGTSDFNVATQATPEFVGVAALDNYGSVYTGRNRLSFSGSWDAPTASGDRLDLFALTTEHNGLNSGRLGYWHLLTPHGLRGELAVSHTTYSLGDVYSSLDAVGRANSVEGQVTYPVILNENRRLTAAVGGALQDLVDEVRSTQTRTPKKVQVVRASLEYSSISSGAATQAGAMLTAGRLRINDATAAAADDVGSQARGAFSKLNVHAEHRQALGKEFQVAVRARAQTSLTGKSLDGSQRLEVSGADGVMVYAPGELLGDTAAVGQFAVSRSFNIGGNVRLEPSIFLDEGWAHNRFAIAGAANSRSIGDAGIGMAATYRQARVEARWATRTHGGTPVGEPTSRSRVLVQASMSF